MVFAALLVEFKGAGLMTCNIMHHDGDHGAHGPKAAPSGRDMSTGLCDSLSQRQRTASASGIS